MWKDLVKKMRHSQQVRRISRALSFGLRVAAILVWASIIPSVAAQPDKIIIYFYSAEANINNYKFLKMEFDGYLAQYGNYEFQPFSDRKTFEEHVKDKTDCLLLLSSWHYSNIYQTYHLKPELVGVRNGRHVQKRILVTTESTTDIEAVKAGQIASASSAQHTKSTLAKIFTMEEASAAFKILTVPKDLDALMSVGFGAAKSALITEHSFENLQTANPPLYKKLKIVAASEETLLLILAVPDGLNQLTEALVNILQHMSTTPDGVERVRLLGLDGWQPIEPSDESKLEG
jgi:hypothetical protein